MDSAGPKMKVREKAFLHLGMGERIVGPEQGHAEHARPTGDQRIKRSWIGTSPHCGPVTSIRHEPSAVRWRIRQLL